MGAEAAPVGAVVPVELGTGRVVKVFGSPGAAVVTPWGDEVMPCEARGE